MESWANPGVLISGDLGIVRPSILGTNTAVCGGVLFQAFFLMGWAGGDGMQILSLEPTAGQMWGSCPLSLMLLFLLCLSNLS